MPKPEIWQRIQEEKLDLVLPFTKPLLNYIISVLIPLSLPAVHSHELYMQTCDAIHNAVYITSLYFKQKQWTQYSSVEISPEGPSHIELSYCNS